MTHQRAPQPFVLSDPLDYEEAREAYRESGRQRRTAREELERRLSDLAEKEKAYRKGRAELRVQCKATTVDDRKVELDSLSADLRYERDVAKGLVDAQQERLAEIDAERAALHRLVEWSTRLDPFAQEQREPPRRAA